MTNELENFSNVRHRSSYQILSVLIYCDYVKLTLFTKKQPECTVDRQTQHSGLYSRSYIEMQSKLSLM